MAGLTSDRVGVSVETVVGVDRACVAICAGNLVGVIHADRDGPPGNLVVGRLVTIGALEIVANELGNLSDVIDGGTF